MTIYVSMAMQNSRNNLNAILLTGPLAALSEA